MNNQKEWEAFFLRGVIDALPDSAAILDSVGKIVQVNRIWINAAVEGSVNDSSYYIGQNYLAVCDSTVGEEQPTALAVAEAIRSILKGDLNDFQLEYPCHTPTEQRWFIARIGHFEFQDRPYIIVMHINITEQILADQQTLEYRTALEISRQFSDFIRKTAHEFRTPLSLIVTCLELYRIQADPDKRTRYIGQIDEQTRYLTRLTEQLNLLASMNREATLDISNVNCNQLAETAHTALHSKAKAKQIALSLELQPDLTLIDGDVYKLLFVLRELIENALRYSPSAAAVIVRTYDSASAVIIEVMDAGIGISAAHTQRIFEPYFKTDPSRALNNSGMGLGLTFVKKIIEMHHGRIEVESVLHQGSIFRLILPISLPSY